MMTVHRTLAALAVVVATVSAAPDRATSTDPTQAPTKAQTGSLDAYLALVESHEAGRSDEPVKTLSEWASLDIARAEAALLRLVAGAERGKYSMVLKRAALLHLDVLCGPWLPADVPLHLQVASRILDPIRRLPDHERFVRTWYLAAAGWMVEVDIWRAGVVLKQALALFPESPDVWLAAGALDEQLASPDVQWTIARAFPSRVSLPGSDPWVAGDYKDIDRNKGFRILGRSKELERAESELRRAVALDASLVEARLRLGRVLLEEGRLTEARTNSSRFAHRRSSHLRCTTASSSLAVSINRRTASRRRASATRRRSRNTRTRRRRAWRLAICCDPPATAKVPSRRSVRP